KGFGARGFSIIEYRLDGKFVRLETIIGVDDEQSKASGSTIFSVWGDGMPLYTSPPLTRDDPPLRVTVDIAGISMLKLISDSMSYGNYDLADWCDTRFYLKASPSSVANQFVVEQGQLFLHPVYHPFHLIYRGETLQVEVLAGDGPIEVAFEYAVSDEQGVKRLSGEEKLLLGKAFTPSSTTKINIPLERLPNGIWTATLRVRSDSVVRAERTVRFGLIDSRLGQPSQSTIFGVNHHEFISSYEPMAAAGIEWSRQWFCWAWIEPKKGMWRWNWHDERIAAAEQHHIKTIGVLGGLGQPNWSSPSNVESGQVTTPGFPANLDDWAEYVRAVATRYKGKVRVWESWNETRNKSSAQLYGWSIKNYADLHRLTYRILKEVDPKNKVLVCADRLSFVDELLSAGLGSTFDGIVIHPYRSEAPDAIVGSAGDLVDVLACSKDWLRSKQRPEAEVWATEIGWFLSGKGGLNVSEKTHGDYLARTYILSQVSQNVAAVCWHDFSLPMFGLFDGKGYPRPSYMAYGALVNLLSGSKPLRQFKFSDIRGALFQHKEKQILALWSPVGSSVASLKFSSEIEGTQSDLYGNSSSFHGTQKGRRVVVTESPSYISTSRIGVSEIKQLPSMFDLTVDHSSATAGQPIMLRLDVINQLDSEGEFRFNVRAAEHLTIKPKEGILNLGPGIKASKSITLNATRELLPGHHEITVTAVAPDGSHKDLKAIIEFKSPLELSVFPADFRSNFYPPFSFLVELLNRDTRPISGRLIFSVPQGFRVKPVDHTFTELAPWKTISLECELFSERAAMPMDLLNITSLTDDGLKVSDVRSLMPVIVDVDDNGHADGWKFFAQNTSKTSVRNEATVCIVPGHSEFLCQKIQCTHFSDGWIILSRESQGTIVKGRRYRITFSARQEGMKGGLSAEVFNIKPWQSCSGEQNFCLSNDWQTFKTEFEAKRSSSKFLFEFFFTETGTVWIENMKLEDVNTAKRSVIKDITIKNK
ncbi:MAG: NPCBM/NEW2 domain-containing protein, partial [Euryarchaeota archaeon]|nr:NPCBM/NEW2 domain-containing protein [Euryarchaeota archaeon]